MIELFKYHKQLWVLTRRDIQARYKQSVVGILWAIIQPFAYMLIFTLVFSLLLKVSSGDIPYPVFTYCTLVPWNFFSYSISRSVVSLESNAALIRKLPLPKEIFPISTVLGAAIDSIAPVVILAGMMIWYSISPSLNMLLVIPIVLVQIIFTVALSLVLSMANVWYHDIRHATPLVLQLWMYATPIAYPITIVPQRFRTLYAFNPMVGIMEGYRAVLLKGSLPDMSYLGIAALGSVVLLLVAYIWFKRAEPRVVDIV